MSKEYAKINSLNEVTNLYAVDDNFTQKEVEDLFGSVDLFIYKETNDSIRERPAMIGGTYDQGNDAFINKQPFSSWTLNSSRDWEAPVTKPTLEQSGGRAVYWNEDNLQWKGMEIVGDNQVFSTWDPDTLTWL